VQPLRAMRDQSARNRQLRVRARVRTGHEAGLRSRRDHLHVDVRAEEASLPDKEQHRSGLHRHVRLQRTVLGEGEPRPSVIRSVSCTGDARAERKNRATCSRFPLAARRSPHRPLADRSDRLPRIIALWGMFRSLTDVCHILAASCGIFR